MKKAFITGIAGQDGYYLSRLLIRKGYEVYGFLRNEESVVLEGVRPVYGNLNDQASIETAITEISPDEIYNLGGISDLDTAIKNPAETLRVNYEAVGAMLSAAVKINPKIRFCQASSREIFGDANPPPQNENANFSPVNPYGEAKLKAYQEYILGFREKGVFTCSAILFNHESPRRNERFVSRKITMTLAKIKLGKAECLELGNLNARRDWGFAGDYVEAMWLMLQQETPGDYVIATGKTHTVRDFVNVAAEAIRLDLTWEGENEFELAKDSMDRVVVRVNPSFYKPLEKFEAVGDISKARSILGWEPHVSFEMMVKEMALKDLELVSNL